VNGALELRDGRLLSWSEDRTLRVWSAHREPLLVLEGHCTECRRTGAGGTGGLPPCARHAAPVDCRGQSAPGAQGAQNLE